VMGLWGSTVDSVVLIVTPERNWPKPTPELRLCVSVHVLLCQTWLDDDSASTTTFFPQWSAQLAQNDTQISKALNVRIISTGNSA